MVSAINTCATKACNHVQSILKSESTATREGKSRLVAPFLAVPVFADAAANIIAGVAKTVWALVTKVVELAYAFFGKGRDYGNFACEAANHFGKALAGVLALPFTFVLGLAVPKAALSLIRGLGLAEAPAKTTTVVEASRQVSLADKSSVAPATA